MTNDNSPAIGGQEQATNGREPELSGARKPQLAITFHTQGVDRVDQILETVKGVGRSLRTLAASLAGFGNEIRELARVTEETNRSMRRLSGE
jgi:hypothetical protein